MSQLLAAFSAGLLFALGLGLSEMTNANKVLGFLDLSGDWDPSLIFVMAGALGMHIILYQLILRRRTPLFALKFQLPTRRDVDAKLLIGSALFGVGWGLGGFCPGPGLVSLAGLGPLVLTFVASMLVGVGLHRWTQGVTPPKPAASAPETRGSAGARGELERAPEPPLC